MCGSASTLHGIAEDPLFRDAPALAGGDIASVEAGCHELRLCGLREEVPGELLDGELVERQVIVKRLNDPIAEREGLPLIVEVHAVGVAIAGDIEPMTRHLFPEVLRC